MFQSMQILWMQLEWYMQLEDYGNIALVLRALADRFTEKREFEMAAELMHMAWVMDEKCLRVAEQHMMLSSVANDEV